jgi:hypothetical protein
VSKAENNNNDYIKKILYGLLEKIIFNENDFSELKKSISNVSLGKLEPKILRKKIIDSRLRILEELIDIFPFYLEQINNKLSLDRFTLEGNQSEITDIDNDKDEFLTQIAQRLENIYQKLRPK